MNALPALQEQTNPESYEFPVMLKPVFVKDDFDGYDQVPNRQAVVRQDTGAVLGMHSNNYNLRPYSQLARPMIEMLRDVAGDGKTRVNLHSNGERLRVDYTSNRITGEVSIGDIVAFRSSMFFSYDGMWADTIQHDGLRLWCLNGCTTAVTGFQQRYRHTKHVMLDIEAEVARAQTALENFPERIEQFKRYTSIKVEFEEVENLFRNTLARLPKPRYDDKGNKTVVNVKRFKALMEPIRWTSCNLWDVYNSATYWASHSNENVVSIRNREDDVAKMLASPEWLELVA